MVAPYRTELVKPGQHGVGVVSDVDDTEVIKHIAGGQGGVCNGHEQKLAGRHGSGVSHPQWPTQSGASQWKHCLHDSKEQCNDESKMANFGNHLNLHGSSGSVLASAFCIARFDSLDRKSVV